MSTRTDAEAEDTRCKCGLQDKRDQLILCKDEKCNHEPGKCQRKQKGKGELRCARCTGYLRKPLKKLDDFDRETAIGFGTAFAVSLPEDTHKHLQERSATMWTEGLLKVKNWDKLPEGAVSLTGGKLEVFHTSAGEGTSKMKSDFYDTVLHEDDRKHLDIFVEHVKGELLNGVKGEYTFENCAFLINMDLKKGKGRKQVVLSTLEGWQPWHLDQPLNKPLNVPAHHLAVIAYLGPSSPTRISTAPHVSVEELCQSLGESTNPESSPAVLGCDSAFFEQCPLMFTKEHLDAFAVNVGGKAQVQLGDCALVGGVHQGVANADRTPRVVFSANLALQGVASYNPDVQLNPVNSALYWGFWKFSVREYIKYRLAGTDLASTCDTKHAEILATLVVDVKTGLKKAVNTAKDLPQANSAR